MDKIFKKAVQSHKGKFCGKHRMYLIYLVKLMHVSDLCEAQSGAKKKKKSNGP